LTRELRARRTCWLLKSNRFSRRALTSPRRAPVVNAVHRVQAELLVLGPDEVEQAGDLVRQENRTG
jgi:hypothetical protein